MDRGELAFHGESAAQGASEDQGGGESWGRATARGEAGSQGGAETLDEPGLRGGGEDQTPGGAGSEAGGPTRRGNDAGDERGAPAGADVAMSGGRGEVPLDSPVEASWNEPALPMAWPAGMAPRDREGPGEFLDEASPARDLPPQPDPSWPRLFAKGPDPDPGTTGDGSDDPHQSTGTPPDDSHEESSEGVVVQPHGWRESAAFASDYDVGSDVSGYPGVGGQLHPRGSASRSRTYR